MILVRAKNGFVNELINVFARRSQKLEWGDGGTDNITSTHMKIFASDRIRYPASDPILGRKVVFINILLNTNEQILPLFQRYSVKKNIYEEGM